MLYRSNGSLTNNNYMIVSNACEKCSENMYPTQHCIIGSRKRDNVASCLLYKDVESENSKSMQRRLRWY